jgi:uncharacterized protein
VGEQVGTIAEIRRYPVKSMQGERLEQTELGPLGIPGDRAFALRDLETGKILSAKQPKVGRLLLTCAARYDEPVGADAPARAVVTVGGVEHRTDDPALADALADLLGRPVRVERATATADEVYESWWPEIDGLALSGMTLDLPIAMSTAKGTFTDLAALHLLATASLGHLGELAPDLSLSIDRFRPGIVVEAPPAEAFVEKGWTDRRGTVGGATLAFGSETPRCVMTTLEQLDLPRQPGVLQAIAAGNRVDMAGLGNFACLGVYAEVDSPGTVSVGDALTLDDLSGR